MSSTNVSRPLLAASLPPAYSADLRPFALSAPSTTLVQTLGAGCATRIDCNFDWSQLADALERAPQVDQREAKRMTRCYNALAHVSEIPLCRAFSRQPWEQACAAIGPTLGALFIICPEHALLCATQLMLAVKRDIGALSALERIRLRPQTMAADELKLPILAIAAAFIGRVALAASLDATLGLTDQLYVEPLDSLLLQPHTLVALAASLGGWVLIKTQHETLSCTSLTSSVALIIAAATLVIAHTELTRVTIEPLQMILMLAQLNVPLLLLARAHRIWQTKMDRLLDETERGLEEHFDDALRLARFVHEQMPHNDPHIAARCLMLWQTSTPRHSRLPELFTHAVHTGHFEPLTDVLMPLAAPELPDLNDMLFG